MDGSRLEQLYFSAIARSTRAQQYVVGARAAVGGPEPAGRTGDGVPASTRLTPGYQEWREDALLLEIARLDLEGAAADLRAAYKLLAGLT